ncbi:hypothetical protein ACNJEI_17795, partial [Mycobacterium tuberculosis]
STSTAATSRRSNSRLPTTLNARDQPPAEVSDQRVSGLTGAVQKVRVKTTSVVCFALPPRSARCPPGCES